MKAIVICSGGLDSVTLAHKIYQLGDIIRLVSFDYGQRHRRELDFAGRCAARLGVRHDIVNISGVGRMLTGSSLMGDGDIPEGHYAEESMKSTVVPNRNAIMLAIAFGMAQSLEADTVATAVHGGDHFIYPDCRPGFISAFQAMQDQAQDGFADIQLYTPYVTWSKADIVAEGAILNVPFADTWSCYKGGISQCGRCGTCVERRQAFDLAQVNDPTTYEDPDYWKTAVAAYDQKGDA
jgi:7-cyano-7-deazaguanine synthase